MGPSPRRHGSWLALRPSCARTKRYRSARTDKSPRTSIGHARMGHGGLTRQASDVITLTSAIVFRCNYQVALFCGDTPRKLSGRTPLRRPRPPHGRSLVALAWAVGADHDRVPRRC
jgi:hypothetical protein